MRYENQCHISFALQGEEKFDNRVTIGGIEIAGWFVGKQ
jgi:hypothetical protein